MGQSCSYHEESFDADVGVLAEVGECGNCVVEGGHVGLELGVEDVCHAFFLVGG